MPRSRVRVRGRPTRPRHRDRARSLRRARADRSGLAGGTERGAPELGPEESHAKQTALQELGESQRTTKAAARALADWRASGAELQRGAPQ